MLTRSDIEALSNFRSRHFLATTLYLPLDIEQQAKYPILARDLARKAEAQLGGQELSREALASAHQDLADLERFVCQDFDRAGALGLAVFCCAGERYWKVYPLPVGVLAKLVQNTAFYVRPLAGLLDEYPPIMLVLIDKRRARLFQVRMGEVQKRVDIISDVPSKVHAGGYAGYAERSIRGHIKDHVHRHFEKVAASVFDLFQEQGFEWLVLGGPEPTLTGFIASLHPYLRERLRGTLTIRVEAPDSKIIEAGRQMERRLKTERDSELIAHVKEGLCPGGWAVSGLSDTLQLVAQGEVRTLLVRSGFSQEGVWCPRCRLLVPDAEECPRGCGEAQRVRDVVDEAVGLALEQGAEVAHVEHEAMEDLGNMAGLLRYVPREIKT